MLKFWSVINCLLKKLTLVDKEYYNLPKSVCFANVILKCDDK